VTHAYYLRRLKLVLEDGNNAELLHQAKGVPLLPLPQPFFRLPCGKWKCHVALPPFVDMVNTITKQIGNNRDDRDVVVIQPVKE